MVSKLTANCGIFSLQWNGVENLKTFFDCFSITSSAKVRKIVCRYEESTIIMCALNTGMFAWNCNSATWARNTSRFSVFKYYVLELSWNQASTNNMLFRMIYIMFWIINMAHLAIFVSHPRMIMTQGSIRPLPRLACYWLYQRQKIDRQGRCNWWRMME